MDQLSLADSMSLADSVEQLVFWGVALTALALAEATPGLELTFLQWRAIVVVGDLPNGARVGQVATRLGGGLPAISRLLRRLERRDLLVLAPDPEDRRATRAQLTAEGWRIRTTIIEWRRRRIESMVAETSGTVGASEQFAAELSRFAAGLWRLV